MLPSILASRSRSSRRHSTATTKNTDGTRTTNYTTTLDAAFSSIASLGGSGCGFEQPIESVKRALNNNPANAGFLRPNANLAIVMVTDEDDCSFAHSTLLEADTTTLGPLQSFRCTRFGITCDTGGASSDEMNEIGPKSGCHSNETSAYLTPVAPYATFFTGKSVCMHDGGAANPGVRVAELAAIGAATAGGGRVIAIGTTVVRALEAAAQTGALVAGGGVATLRVDTQRVR